MAGLVIVNLTHTMFLKIVHQFKNCFINGIYLSSIITIFSFFISINVNGQSIDRPPFLDNFFKSKCTEISQSNYVEEFTYTPNAILSDTLIVKIYYEEGCKVKCEAYYTNGGKYRLSTFKNNKKSGADITWYKNGAIKNFAYYQNDSIILPWESFYSSGNIESIINGRDKTEWYENGKLRSTSVPIDSSEYGYVRKRYHENGNLEDSAAFNIGPAVYKWYYKDGTLGIQGKMLNLTISRVGKWQLWYENGNIKEEAYYDEHIPNLPCGTWTKWSEDGKVIEQEVF